MTESEQKMLTAAYGSALPESMSAEYYNTMLYLAARGIIDDSYTAEMLYKPLTWRDMYILLSRVADKDSRLTFKTVTLPYDLEMAEDGFMAVTPAITQLRPMDIESNIEDGTYKDIFIEKNSYTTFKNKNGKETDPFISKQFASPMPSYGVLMDNNFKDSYYWFRIYNSVPVPSCYKDDSAKDTVIIPTTKQAVHCYSIMADDSSKVLYVENTSINNGIYQYYNEDGICKYNGYMIEPSQLATISGVDGITLTAEDDEKISELSQENYEYPTALYNRCGSYSEAMEKMYYESVGAANEMCLVSIQSGLLDMVAYDIRDEFIKEFDNAVSLPDLYDLVHGMAHNYALKMKFVIREKQHSPRVVKMMTYIEEHLTDKIELQQIALSAAQQEAENERRNNEAFRIQLQSQEEKLQKKEEQLQNQNSQLQIKDRQIVQLKRPR